MNEADYNYQKRLEKELAVARKGVKAMILTEEQRKELEAAARPLLKWLNDNCHPHTEVTVTAGAVKLSEDVANLVITDYIKD